MMHAHNKVAIGNAATEITSKMATGVPQANGTVAVALLKDGFRVTLAGRRQKNSQKDPFIIRLLDAIEKIMITTKAQTLHVRGEYFL